MRLPMEPTELHSTDVDLAGLLRVLGHNLYSTPTVAIRELVQNAHDSCTRRRLLDDSEFTPTIRLHPDPATGTLRVEDQGAGLTREEIMSDLATVGAGATGRMRDEGAEEAGLIGRFGLGFLSAFFVSEKVEVHTTSWKQPDRGWRFASTGGERYALSEAEPREVGTSVLLHLGEAHSELADPGILAELLEHHCRLLPLDVHVGAGGPINRPRPPWRLDEAAEETELRRRKLDLEFAALFEPVFEPLCTFRVAPDENSDVHGLVWIQDGGTYGNSDNRMVRAHVRGMLVDDDARELLPHWAGFAGAVVESDSLTPTASREDLQKDDAWHAAQRRIREVLVEGLASLARSGSPTWRLVSRRHDEALRGAALCDDRLFDALADEVRVPTSEGDLTPAAILEQADGRFLVSIADECGGEEMLHRAARVPVVDGTRYAAFAFCRTHSERRGGQLITLGTEKANDQLFRPAEVEDGTRAWMKELLGGEGLEVLPCRFEPTTLPLVVVPDREAELKKRIEDDEADKRIGSAALGLARSFTAKIDGEILGRVFVNADCPLIQRLDGLEPVRREAAAAILRSLADLMAGRESVRLEGDLPAAMARLTSSLELLLEPEGGSS